MHLKIKVLDDKPDLVKYYSTLNNEREDAGLDLLFPNSFIIPGKATGFKLPMGIAVEPEFDDNTLGFFVMPRSSICKTTIRQSNSIGLVDKGYRGQLYCIVDNISENPYTIMKDTRLFQIVDASCKGITCSVVESLTDSVRGTGGIGSTGK
tara:strand:+ start:151 stop:603 length:453 start_codon:yes stop_codon:yes gene_type:complete